MEDDLNALFDRFFSQPGNMEKLQGVLSSLNADNGEKPPPPAAPDLSALQKLLPLLGGLSKDDKDPNVALLRALRPYLHDGREKRVDEAIELLRLMKLLPLLGGK